MNFKDELEYVRDDLKGISESDKVTFHGVTLLITPHWEKRRMTEDYYFRVTIHDYYDSETDDFVTLENVVVRYWGKYEINLVELLESDNRAIELQNIFGCGVHIGYANYTLDYDEELSKELERRVQSTWECIYCAIHDL